MFTVKCTNCNKEIHLPPEAAGRVIRCPHCKALVTLPFDPLEPLDDGKTPVIEPKKKPKKS
jgi:hypothetical protein